MAEILDIAHLAFLEMIRDAINTTGGAAAKGQLMRKAMSVAEDMPETEYQNLKEWEEAVKAKENPITRVEGHAQRKGNIFYLPACPFAPSIKTYKELFESLPQEYPRLVEEYNKPTKIARDLKVGHGSGVSPFCAIHQPLRASIGRKIKVGGKSVKIYQLGCKSGDGKKGLAKEFIEEFGTSEEEVSSILDNAMCAYGVKVED